MPQHVEDSVSIPTKMFGYGITVLCGHCRIVLEAGYFMDSVSFFENIITILVYAVIVSNNTHCVCMYCLVNLVFNCLSIILVQLPNFIVCTSDYCFNVYT